MRLTELAHQHLRKVVRPGDLVIDATAGNGHDTLELARLVGPTGKVLSIDLQAQAIESTRRKLAAANQLARCELIRNDHADALEALRTEYRERAAAITFNLGYLPGGDQAITTQPETTRRALEAARQLLHPGGLLLVTAYRGHPGGQTEAETVASAMRDLDPKAWQVEAVSPPVRDPGRIPPILWTAQRQNTFAPSPS